jgi:hypothetical protein
MFGDPELAKSEKQDPPGTSIEGIPYDGVDRTAAWRMHMRDQTMARQAAERRNARSAGQNGIERWEQLALVQERALELSAEMERIDAEHQTWLHRQEAVAQ